METGPRQVWKKSVQGIQKSKIEKGNVAQVKGSSFGGTVQVVQAVKKPQPKKGKGGLGSSGKKTKRGRQKRVQYHNCR